MNIPQQTKPVNRHAKAARQAPKGVVPSGSCGCPNQCYGLCVFGNCVGYCG